MRDIDSGFAFGHVTFRTNTESEVIFQSPYVVEPSELVVLLRHWVLDEVTAKLEAARKHLAQPEIRVDELWLISVILCWLVPD